MPTKAQAAGDDFPATPESKIQKGKQNSTRAHIQHCEALKLKYDCTYTLPASPPGVTVPLHA